MAQTGITWTVTTSSTISTVTGIGVSTSPPAAKVKAPPKPKSWFDYDPATEPAPVPSSGHHAIVPVNGWKIGITQLDGPCSPAPDPDEVIGWVMAMQDLGDEEATVLYEGRNYRLIRVRTQQSFTYWGGHASFISLYVYGTGYGARYQPPHQPPFVDPASLTFAWEGGKVSLQTIAKLTKDNPYLSPYTHTCGNQCYTQTTQRWQAEADAMRPKKLLEKYMAAKVPAPHKEYDDWKWLPHERKGCGYCGSTTLGVYGQQTANEAWAGYRCVSCYQNTMQAREGIEKVPGMPTWYRMAHKKAGLRPLTLPEKVRVAEWYAEHHFVYPSQFEGLGFTPPKGALSSIAYDAPAGEVSSKKLTLPAIGPGEMWGCTGAAELSLMHTNFNGISAGFPLGSWQQTIDKFKCDTTPRWSVRLSWMQQCGVCGYGVYEFNSISPVAWWTQEQVDQMQSRFAVPSHRLGLFHPHCMSALEQSGLLDAEGMVKHEECGQWVHKSLLSDLPTVSVHGTVACRMCLSPYSADNKASTSECPGCEYNNRIQNGADANQRIPGYCLRCSAYRRHGRNWNLDKTPGVDPMFPLAMAVADFYMLSDLAVLHTDANDHFQKVAQNLAEVLKNYAILACGGEARHHSSHRSTGSIYVETVEADDLCGDEEVWCPHKHTILKDSECSCPRTRPHRRIVSIRGAAPGLPLPRTRRRKGMTPPAMHNIPPEHKLVRVMYKDRVVWKGVTYEVVTHRTPEQTSLYSAMPGLGRTDAWIRFSEYAADKPAEAMEWCRDLFWTGEWPGGFGGYWWGLAADLTCQYLSGQLSHVAYADAMCGTQHNGGTLFNKIFLCNSLDKLLDWKRIVPNSGYLWPWASQPVLDMYCDLAELTQEPLRLAWAKEIRKRAVVDDLTRRYQYVKEAGRRIHGRELGEAPSEHDPDCEGCEICCDCGECSNCVTEPDIEDDDGGD